MTLEPLLRLRAVGGVLEQMPVFQFYDFSRNCKKQAFEKKPFGKVVGYGFFYGI
jgi:hypothetical protein